MALPPRRPQTFNVEPGTIKFSEGGPEDLADYAFQRPMTPRGEIPQSLQGRSYLRPLMQGNSDGSAMSLADMEANSRAMDALDQFFSIDPAIKNLEMARMGAERSKFEALEEDPLVVERTKHDLETQRRMFELDQQARLAREKEEAQYGSFDQFVDKDTEDQIARIMQSNEYTNEAERQADINLLKQKARTKQLQVREYNIAGRPKDEFGGGR